MKILNFKKVEDFYKKEKIQMIRLNDYIRQKKISKIDILKIDTEGYELRVLKGLSGCHKIIKYIYF